MRITSVTSSFVLALCAACTGSAARAPSTHHATDAAGSVAVDTSRAPLSLPVQAITVRGELSVYRAGAWQQVREGDTAAAVRELRVARRGAIVALGSAADAPLLYLRAGTRVAVSDGERGVRIEVREGRVRVTRGAGTPVVVVTEDGEQLVSGDVLVDAKPQVRSDVRATATRMREAQWSFALTQEDAGAGAGRMEARAAADKMEPVALRSLHVAVTTAGDQAVTEVTHIFHNASAERREGTFRFPFPDGASLVGLAMEIDGKMMEGEFVERDKARAVYEKIVDEMLDPALLEWEQGNWFKLRVFPLEPDGDKRIVIRYVAPLTRAANGGWEYAYDVSAPGQAPIDSLVVSVDGVQVLAQRTVTQGVDLVVPVAAGKVPRVMREERTDGTYAALRITPAVAWAATQRMPLTSGRNVAIVIDTSRSSLEARQQELDVLASTVRQLSPTDKLAVLASDVGVQEAWQGYVPVDAEALARATKFIEGIEPDGATDLGATFAALAARAPSDVIYIGDGLPTWGELRTDALAQAARKIAAPIDAALVGKGASSELWAELAGVTGGRAMIVRSRMDEQRFAVAAGEPAAPRLVGAKLVAPSGVVLFPTTASTLAEGDDLFAVLKVPAGEKLPAAITLTGTLAGAPYSERISLAPAVATPRVAQRWARQQLAAMEAADAPREDIVALSTEHGVMSKYTSLLVLENEEAYKQHQIERKQAQAQQAQQLAQSSPTVTGGDLDTLGARRASLSPDEIQPGDPEIKIPAPRDATSVVVTFPFGETKLAEWDSAVGAWMVRFLVDQATADGVYHARVTITHADGRIEVLRLPYTVDTKAPVVRVTATKLSSGAYRIVVRQQGRGPRDADRVEVALPDGTTLRLTMKEWGKFEGVWTPASPLTAPLTLSVVARDNALNQSITELVLP